MRIYVKTVRYKYSPKRSAKCEVGSIAMPVYNQMSEAEKSNLAHGNQRKKPKKKSKFTPKGNGQV